VDDLETMLLASRRLGVPMIVGSAGDTGSNSRVDLFVGIIRDLAKKHRLARFRIGYFYSEVRKDALHRRIVAGDTIAGLDARPPLDLVTLDATDRIVAMAGIHPYIELLDEGADVIIGGIEFELAELTGKGQVLLVGHRLAAEAQHQVGEPGGANSGAVGGAERLADVDAGDIGA
jgi:hypothetical protein